jgi:hypothetical protein
MNNSELTNNAPSWTVVVKVTLPSTFILFIFDYVGEFIWTSISGRARSGGDLQPLPYFVGDKRDPDSRTFSSINNFRGTFNNDYSIAA